jgi:putative nucleotidyltransferase with HDIG domain
LAAVANAMMRILFVDDEQKVLDALKRTIRPMRDEWDAEFVDSGALALKALALRPFDAIVTDLKMPVMDGATLLREVMDQYPQILRVTLSGHLETGPLMLSSGVAHQFMPKPCQLEDLTLTITRAVTLRRVLNDPQLRSLVCQIGTLPTVPPLYLELMKLLDFSYATLDQIGRVIAKDMGMCAKILQFANSAMFNRGREISDPGVAAGALGFNTVKNLCLAAQVFKSGRASAVPGFNVEVMWTHSLKVGQLAERIVQAMAEVGGDARSQAQVSGLLHDVGRLVMVQELASRYETTLTLCKEKRLPLHQAERETFGVSHAELGAHILALWGLPEAVVEAIAFHHSPDRIKAVAGKELMTAVYAAELMTKTWSPAASRPPEAMQECLTLLQSVAPGKTALEWRDLYDSIV